MADVVTSESSDVSFSSSVSVTAAETGTGSLAGHVSAAKPVIVRVTILLVLAVINLCGNGFTLTTIRLTPRLWTKTNFILASMLVADLITGVSMFWYSPLMVFVYVFNNPCRYNVLISLITSLYKGTAFVSAYHLILISVERYIAVVYPLHYETKFTDRILKWAIAACWVTGIVISISFTLWLINADLQKCVLIPDQYQLVDAVLVYLPVCITMFICYGKILAISWRHRQRIEPMNVDRVPGAKAQLTTEFTQPPTESNKAESIDDRKENPLAGNAPSVRPAVPSGETSAELAEQQRQIKSRRREFKAVYLTAAIVGTFVILWFPHVLGRILASIGYNPIVVNYIFLASGAIGASNFAFSWAIYAAVSKKYRRAYRQMLTRIGCCCCKNVTLPADNSLVV